jgi:hypothetical protein
MKAKLIKSDIQYRLHNKECIVIATSLENGKLSLKNCQAIERGYDLDELAKEYVKISSLEFDAFESGFQKALEILGDKKFSEDDVLKVVTHILNELVFVDGFDKQYLFPESIYQETTAKCKSLQQTEWDVEIVMETCSINPSNLDCSEIVERPKHNADGCLILKRK